MSSSLPDRPLPDNSPSPTIPSLCRDSSLSTESSFDSTKKPSLSPNNSIDIQEGMTEPAIKLEDVKLEDAGGLVTTASEEEAAERKRIEEADPYGNEDGHEVKYKTMGWV
jgi:hypothetical protein